MPLQETMHFFSQLAANPFRGGDFVNGRFTQTIQGTKLSQEKILPVLTHTGTIVKNAFADALFHEQLMVGIGETMCFIANALEQTQSAGIDRQLQRQRPAGPINLLVFLREPDNGEIMQSEPLQLATCRRKLAFPAVDNNEISKTNVRLQIEARGLRIRQTMREFERILLRVFRSILSNAFRFPLSGILNR